jgi:DNA polymerase-3 subunit delta
VADFVGLVLLLGPESILADRAQSQLKAKNPHAAVTNLVAAELEVGMITDSLAPSLFGEARIIAIKEIQDLSGEAQDEVITYLNSPDEEVTLILWHNGGVKGKALLDRIKKSEPEIISCQGIKKEGDKLDFVQGEFAALGRKITSGAMQDLVDALGSDLRELGNACSQLSADVTAGRTIDEAAVAKFYQGRIETTGFDVADATLDGRTDLALITLRNALASGVDPVMIISALAGSIRTLAKVSGASRGMKSFDLAANLKLAPWQIDKARRQLGGWTPVTLAAAVIAIAQADADIKGASADPAYALERTIITISRSRIGS